MRQAYSTQLTNVTGVLLILLTALFAAIRSHDAGFTKETAVPVPHAFEGHEECTACHGLKSISPYPRRHNGWKNSSCPKCHPFS